MIAKFKKEQISILFYVTNTKISVHIFMKPFVFHRFKNWWFIWLAKGMIIYFDG